MALQIILFATAGTTLFLLVRLLIELRRKRLERAYQDLAEEYEAQYWAGDFWQCPSIQFSHDGMPAMLLASNEIVHVDAMCRSGASSRYYTQLHIAWPDDSLCEIAPRSRFDWQSTRQSSRVDLGDKRFNDRFVVRSDESEFARELLNSDVQDRLLLLRYLQRVPDLYVRFGDGALVIKKRGILRDAAALQRFARLSLEVYDLAVSHRRFRDKLARLLGICFVERHVQMDLAEANCPYCGGGFADHNSAVVCERCHTPHHEDCWCANGCCTIFACGERAAQSVA